jgi:hypothetical protein
MEEVEDADLFQESIDFSKIWWNFIFMMVFAQLDDRMLPRVCRARRHETLSTDTSQKD